MWSFHTRGRGSGKFSPSVEVIPFKLGVLHSFPQEKLRKMITIRYRFSKLLFSTDPMGAWF